MSCGSSESNPPGPRITTRRGFPVDQAAHTVYLTYRIEIGNKFAASRQHSKKFDLEMVARLVDANTLSCANLCSRWTP